MNLEEAVEAGLGAGAAVVLAERSAEVNVRLANNTVTTNGLEQCDSAGVVAIEGDRVAGQSADLSAPEGARELALEARRRASTSPPAPDAAPLLEPAEAASQGAVEATETSPADLEPVLPRVLALLERSREEGLRCFGYLQAQSALELLGTRTGVRLQGLRRSASLGLTLKTQDLGRSVWAGASARQLSELDPEAMFARLRQRLDWTSNRVSLPAGRYQVILEPSATADLVVRLLWEMHARGADEGRTVFAGSDGSRVGERMYASSVNLSSDPEDASMAVPGFVRALGSSEYASVFDNGLAAPRVSWVEQGVQQELICPRRWAQDHGHPVRSYVENLRMEGGESSLEEMIRSSERALLVTSLFYIRDVDPTRLLLTGLTRDGVFLIERGEVVGAVNNFRFNESPVGVLERTLELGRVELPLSREIGGELFLAAPTIRVDDFFMSSVSDAI